MIWLASFPRSGNTFFRIVLYEVYGIESSTFHMEKSYPVDADYYKYPVVKTHLLPHQLVPDDPTTPAVYIVRDGRDAVVSMANQRKDLIAPESDFEDNLSDAIRAVNGSFFGGWSRNVTEWLKRASIVIRFEDLIANPIKCVERIRPLIDLPEPRFDRVPSFDDLKTKNFRYGSGVQHGFPLEQRAIRREKFFRRGKVGAWKDEMPDYLHRLFWELHGETMKRLGYTDGLFRAQIKWGLKSALRPLKRLIEKV
jgi:hypothetical protein